MPLAETAEPSDKMTSLLVQEITDQVLDAVDALRRGTHKVTEKISNTPILSDADRRAIEVIVERVYFRNTHYALLGNETEISYTLPTTKKAPNGRDVTFRGGTAELVQSFHEKCENRVAAIALGMYLDRRHSGTESSRVSIHEVMSCAGLSSTTVKHDLQHIFKCTYPWQVKFVQGWKIKFLDNEHFSFQNEAEPGSLAQNYFTDRSENVDDHAILINILTLLISNYQNDGRELRPDEISQSLKVDKRDVPDLVNMLKNHLPKASTWYPQFQKSIFESCLSIHGDSENGWYLTEPKEKQVLFQGDQNPMRDEIHKQ